MENRKNIIATINNERVAIDCEKAFMPLASYLRSEANLTGTKVVCAEGDCGACTVLIGQEVGADGKLIFKSVNSCILPLYLIDGAQVITVEGIKESDTTLHPVQQAMIECQGAQCGYCTPGFICAMAGMTEKYKAEKKIITEKKAKNFLTGNLCRCTGYKPIVDALLKVDLNKMSSLKERYHNPDWLLEMKKIRTQSVVMNFSGKSIFIPITLKEALSAKKAQASLRVIGGSTDLGVVVNKGRMITDNTMALYHIEELRSITHDEKMITVGATATLTEFEEYIENFIPELKRMLHIFASPQIKNQATLIGNIVNGSPIADSIPFLMVSEAVLVLKNASGTREVNICNFYLGYKQIDLKPDEIVVAVKIPRLNADQKLRLYKVSIRKDMDISAATFAGIVELKNNKIVSAKFALGGVAATVIRLGLIESKIVGKEFTKVEFESIAKEIPNIISPLSDLRASKEYRLKVVQNYFLKFHNEISRGDE